MQPFYELSQLTQRQRGGLDGAMTLGATTRGVQAEAVKVIEIKTVGAYQLAVLSARDAGSLDRWLKVHDYSLPEGKAGIIDEYIRKDWYFIAAKIKLDKPVASQEVSPASTKDTEAQAKAREAIRKQLSGGELHPLLISFDTPRCIYPLRISAVSGEPSEVSLYVLSAEALLDQFIFGKHLERLHQQKAERDGKAKEREKIGRRSMQNIRSMQLAAMMYGFAAPGDNARGRVRDWSLEDIEAIGKESWPDALPEPLDEYSYTTYSELPQCLRVTPEKIPQCARALPRLKTKSWYLTKQVCTFQPQEMRDLEFKPAIPLLAAALSDPAGDAAAAVLRRCGTNAIPVLLAACQSTNSLRQINASSGLQALQDPRLVELLLTLLKDDVPKVRFNAVMATAGNWDPRFIEPLMALFRDPHPRIRQQAAQWLCLHESTNRAPTYVALLRDPDLDIQACALKVVSQINPAAIPRADLLHLLGSPRLDTVTSALRLLQGDQFPGWTYQPPGVYPRFQPVAETNRLSSAEAAPLTMNRLTMARLMGLKILRQNADAQAVALTLPLLRDTNSIVRNRAFALLRTVSGQDIPQDEPAKWEQWWAANKATFVAPKPDR